MQQVNKVKAMQLKALQWKAQGGRIGFVPTMGFLHEGHISLVQEARKKVGSKGLVVLSIYVNPTQFAPHEDLAKYPRNLPRDKSLCRKAGVDVLFFPADTEMYPRTAGLEFSTYVEEKTLSGPMEGISRPTHFR